jgi:putative phosphonate metabolism protein
MTGDGGRYAVYFAPDPGSALARVGAEWLGYDVAAGASVPQPRLNGISAERLHAITEEPRRYGFHATLKPPFVLAEGTDAGELDEAVAALANGVPAFVAPKLRLVCFSGFWALMLSESCPAMDRLAAVCVRELDRFRAPPSTAELVRRRGAGLTPAQDTLLERWGYPYVMQEFRFHMTLTARLDPAESAAVGVQLAPLVEPLCQSPLDIDAVSLFRQDRRDLPFRLVRRYPLAG